MVLHKDSPKQERWNRLKETNPLLRQFSELKQQYDESEHPFVMSMRSVTQTIGGWFDENESAQVQRLMKAMDPTFNMESFERELREYIVPEVVDAYLSADREALEAWCGEAVSFSSIHGRSRCEWNLGVADLQCPVGNYGAIPQAGPCQ